jgi:hypothetical protein
LAHQLLHDVQSPHVIPAEAGIQTWADENPWSQAWIPASAGMTALFFKVQFGDPSEPILPRDLRDSESIIPAQAKA